MNRSEFFKKLIALPIVLLTLYFASGCDTGDSGGGGGDNSGQSVPNPSPSPTPNPTPGPTPGQGQACLNGGESTVFSGGSTPHTHPSTQVPAADVTSGSQMTYVVPEELGHSHTFTLRATNMQILKATGTTSVVTDSDGSGHFHAINVICK